MGKKYKIADVLVIVFFALLSFFLAFAIVEKQMTITGTDYQIHAIKAIDIFRNGLSGILKDYQYPIWDLGVKFFERILRFRLYESAASATAIVYLLTYVEIFFALCYFVGEYVSPKICSCLAFFVLVLQPVSYHFFLGKVTWGLILINPWHNPANATVRPLGIIAFFIFAMLIDRWNNKQEISVKLLVAFAIVLAIADYAKPSFCQVFLPTVVIICVGHCVITRFKSFWLCVGVALSVIPSVLVLLSQMLLTFDENGEGIEIAWFDVISYNWGNIPLAMFRFLVFPMLVSVIIGRDLKKDMQMIVAWVYTAIGFAEYAALAEVGERRYHGNFGWGYVLAVSILQLMALIRLVSYSKESKDKKVWKGMAWTVFAAQAVCGFIYAYWQLTVELFWY